MNFLSQVSEGATWILKLTINWIACRNRQSSKNSLPNSADELVTWNVSLYRFRAYNPCSTKYYPYFVLVLMFLVWYFGAYLSKGCVALVTRKGDAILKFELSSHTKPPCVAQSGFINLELSNAVQTAALHYASPGRRSMGGAWVFPRNTMDCGTFPDLPLLVDLEMRQNSMHPQVRRNAQKYLYFSSFFPLYMCAAFCSRHRRGECLSGLFMCRKASLPAQKQSLQYRHPCTLVQGCLRWRQAAHSSPTKGKDRNMLYYAIILAISLSHNAARWLAVLPCMRFC